MTPEQRLIQAQREYIKFLTAQLDNLNLAFTVYPQLKPSQGTIDEGERRRKEIAEYEGSILDGIMKLGPEEQAAKKWLDENMSDIKSGVISLPRTVQLEDPRCIWKISWEGTDKFRLEKR